MRKSGPTVSACPYTPYPLAAVGCSVRWPLIHRFFSFLLERSSAKVCSTSAAPTNPHGSCRALALQKNGKCAVSPYLHAAWQSPRDSCLPVMGLHWLLVSFYSHTHARTRTRVLGVDEDTGDSVGEKEDGGGIEGGNIAIVV